MGVFKTIARKRFKENPLPQTVEDKGKPSWEGSVAVPF